MVEEILRIVAVGSVDDGKSTLIGRLLLDSGQLRGDQLVEAQRASSGRGLGDTSLAFLTDGLKAERDRGITIDVAYRYFYRHNRKVVLADVPGHSEFLANMVGGASGAEVAIVLLDARHGLVEQTKRHLLILSLFGLSHVVVAVNKMDLVDYSESRFFEIVRTCEAFASKLALQDLVFVPISALEGDNVVSRSTTMSWYEGTTIAYFLDHVTLSSEENLVDLRFPVQSVEQWPEVGPTMYGRVASGVLRTGEELVVLPSLDSTRVASISVGHGNSKQASLQEAVAGRWIAATLEGSPKVRRGSLLVRRHNIPHCADVVDATLIVLSRERALTAGDSLLVQIGTDRVAARVDEMRYRLDVSELHRRDAEALGTNDIGRGLLSLSEPRWLDTARQSRRTGTFLALAPDTFDILAVGFIRDLREIQRDHRGCVVWLTGLPASGKSTVAQAAVEHLAELGFQAVRLDGDVFRSFVSDDLGFSAEERRENVRRAAGVAALLASAGHLVIASFVSPYESDRRAARERVGSDGFIEVHVRADVATCRTRDPKGLYARASRGEIVGFTGVDAPYEAPTSPDIVLDTERISVTEAAEKVVDFLRLTGRLSRPVRQTPGVTDRSLGRPGPL